MATVYLARTDQGAQRAIKIIPFPPGERGARTRQRFLREGTALAKVDRHPGIVRIHDCQVDEAHGCGYHVLEYVEGSDLGQLLGEGLLPPERALSLAEQVASALAHVHAAGIVHRDLKPANVLVRQDGQALLTDFGVARDESDDRLTQSGALVGTPHYMAPEQASGHWSAVGPWSDVFALGVLAYELTTGELPFQGTRPVEILAQIAVAEPPPPSQVRPGLPRDLDVIVARALSKEGSQRPTATATATAPGPPPAPHTANA
jgi:serine/threonine protein kinase